MPAEISYVTKIVDIQRVLLRGKLDYRDVDDRDRDAGSAWFVDKDNLEEYLWKLDGKHVTIEIKVITGADESHLDVADGS